MFFVTLLLNQTLAWMRAQSGTTSLRAILYMDEIAGYFPPVANPPAKAPLLTLLKQAPRLRPRRRARDAESGRPRLQGALERRDLVSRPAPDRARQGARARRPRGRGRGRGAEVRPRRRWSSLLAGLGNRVFLLNNVHEDGPEVFETRWALSYLSGPLTRAQIKTLMDPRAKGCGPRKRRRAPRRPRRREGRPPRHGRCCRPASRSSSFPSAARARGRLPAGPLGVVEAHFEDRRAASASTETLARVAAIADPRRLVGGRGAGVRGRRTSHRIPRAARGSRRSVGGRAGEELRGLGQGPRDLGLPRADAATVWKSPSSGDVSKPGESEADFRGRLQQGARAPRRRGRRPAGEVRAAAGRSCRSGCAAPSRPSRARSRRPRRRVSRPRSRSARPSSAPSSGASRSPRRRSARRRRRRAAPGGR